MLWPGFPKRLQSALKGLCCLARSGSAMRSQEIANRIGVSKAETAKVLQLLVWGGFVTSRRGAMGGFRLAEDADQLTTGEVIKFFLAKYQAPPDGDCPIMLRLRETIAPCQEAFARLRLVEIARSPSKRSTGMKVSRRSVWGAALARVARPLTPLHRTPVQ
jgi:Rrf2 family protein